MKHFVNLKDISSKDLKKILIDAKRRKKLRNSLKRQPSKLKLKHGYDPKNWGKMMKNAFSSMGEGFIDSRPEELSLQDWVEFSAQIEKSKNDL